MTKNVSFLLIYVNQFIILQFPNEVIIMHQSQVRMIYCSLSGEIMLFGKYTKFERKPLIITSTKKTLYQLVNLFHGKNGLSGVSVDNLPLSTNGLHHIFLNHAKPTEVIYDVVEDRKNLEALFKKPIRGMAYAFGAYNAEILPILKSAGIAYSRTVVATNSFNLPSEPLTLHPTCHHNSNRLSELCGNFLALSPKHDPKMFYLWGHSYEFDNDNNWNVIEEFCEKMGGHDNIWYATNIEIIEYMEAFNSLIYSYDGRIIKNPTNTDIYIFETLAGRGSNTYVIPKGETVILD
jgi:hypothetical protein